MFVSFSGLCRMRSNQSCWVWDWIVLATWWWRRGWKRVDGGRICPERGREVDWMQV